MKTYTLFWLSGNTEIVTGNNIAEAMLNAGYGSATGLDFYNYGDTRKQWDWDKIERRWFPNRTA